MRHELCPGYFERDVQEIIEAKGPKFTAYFCALCGQQVKAINPDGGWVPVNHSADPVVAKN